MRNTGNGAGTEPNRCGTRRALLLFELGLERRTTAGRHFLVNRPTLVDRLLAQLHQMLGFLGIGVSLSLIHI